jgi:hypothetical protein
VGKEKAKEVIRIVTIAVFAAAITVSKDSPVNGTSATVFRLMSDS